MIPEGQTYQYTVTVAKGNNVWGTGNKFYLNGIISPHINFTAGNKYRFLQGDSTNTNHPLRFSTIPNGTHAGGIQYTNGVVIKGNNGTPSKTKGNSRAETRSNLYFIKSWISKSCISI